MFTMNSIIKLSRNLKIRKRFHSLVIAEHDGTTVNSGTLSAISAASKIGNVTVLLVGQDLDNAALHSSGVSGVSKVLTVKNEIFRYPVAEYVADAVKFVSSLTPFSHIIAPSSNYGKNMLPRLSALINSMPLTDVVEIINEKTFKRPFYAGNAIATVEMTDDIKILLIRTTAFEKAATGNTNSAPIEDIMLDPSITKLSPIYSKYLSQNTTKSLRPELSTARIVVSGGRAMKNAENFAMLETLADKLGGGAVGASRAAVDSGFVPNDYQVGQTGKVVAPDLYVAVGISGAIQHLCGMKDSKVIVAINNDKEAPIFKVADFGIIGDLFKIIPELNSKL